MSMYVESAPDKNEAQPGGTMPRLDLKWTLPGLRVVYPAYRPQVTVRHLSNRPSPFSLSLLPASTWCHLLPELSYSSAIRKIEHSFHLVNHIQPVLFYS